MAYHMIHIAAREGDLYEVRGLSAQDPALLDIVSGADGRTPVLYASAAGHSDVVKFCLDKGARLEPRDRDGMTAVHCACCWAHTDVLALLLERGADVTSPNRRGFTPLITAAYRGHERVVDMLLRHGGSNVDATNKHGQSALWFACYRGHDQVLAKLLEAGADPTLKDRKRRSPMQVAEEGNHQACVKLLKDWSRDLHLTKARRVADATYSITRCPAAVQAKTPEEARSKRVKVAVAFLERRVARGKQLPSAVHKHHEGPALTSAVLGHVMGDMMAELFSELLGCADNGYM